ncbi:SH3 domain-containing protein [Massilia endophytica]|uniref:SH3 domain-containing protein n=1 Tax=Massilia endophytica TaxID=2899220 RepID=UPI001E4899E6|nr:SH3 domain-containing protein [Massilia endophytica]UGQ46143.1 hypothetical protein LSQ66_20605 [Massilia endophytica]
MNISRLLFALLLLLAALAGQAADFKTVGATPVVLYDAPSLKGNKLFIVPRGAPLEVVLSYGEWVKVRDITGDLAWTQAKGLSPKRNVVVKSANVKVKAEADESSTTVFVADKSVILEYLEPAANDWTKVRHRDGLIGYIRNADIWGI